MNLTENVELMTQLLGFIIWKVSVRIVTIKTSQPKVARLRQSKNGIIKISIESPLSNCCTESIIVNNLGYKML